MILVVDDHPGTARAVARLLHRVGCPADVATSGRDAIAACARWRPDVVLLDLRMPDMDGFAVADRLKGDERTAGIRLVAMTADDDERTRARAGAHDFDEFLRKPVRLDTLCRALGLAEEG